MIIVAGQLYVDPADVEEIIADARATYPVARANLGNVIISFCVDDSAVGKITVLEQ